MIFIQFRLYKNRHVKRCNFDTTVPLKLDNSKVKTGLLIPAYSPTVVIILRSVTYLGRNIENSFNKS